MAKKSKDGSKKQRFSKGNRINKSASSTNPGICYK